MKMADRLCSLQAGQSEHRARLACASEIAGWLKSTPVYVRTKGRPCSAAALSSLTMGPASPHPKSCTEARGFDMSWRVPLTGPHGLVHWKPQCILLLLDCCHAADGKEIAALVPGCSASVFFTSTSSGPRRASAASTDCTAA